MAAAAAAAAHAPAPAPPHAGPSAAELEAAVLAQLGGSSIANTLMSSLLAVFPQHLLAALDIIDRRRITRLVVPRRTVYQVERGVWRWRRGALGISVMARVVDTV